MPLPVENISLVGWLFAVVEVIAIITAIHAILNTRTSQGAIAWAFFLVTMPFLGLPLYALLGRHKLKRHVQSRRDGSSEIHQSTVQLETRLQPFRQSLVERSEFGKAIENLSGAMFTAGNTITVFDSGEETFKALFAAIDQAQDYLLLAFYIVNDDELGDALKERLIRRRRDGVRIYFLYDSIGSYRLSRAYKHELLEAGVKFQEFGSYHFFRNRYVLNFRNHRKICVADGRVGFTGGYNVSNEYLGESKRYGVWRDTHIRLSGPSVLGLQAAFLEDWSWVTGEAPDLNWTVEEEGDKTAMVIPTGPADTLDTCSLFFMQMLQAAKQRAWITSPYFVPSEAVLETLKLAALRGVDVRVMLPGIADKRTVWYAAYAYIQEAQAAGVTFYRYQRGFLHQKVILVDDDLAVVGTANLDNRSFRLNFELSVLVPDRTFAERIEEMLTRDFVECRRISRAEATTHSFPVRIVIACARLLSPIL
ncbi:MAG: cardiolipin synthase [Desulfuromonadales bacterium]